MGAGRIPWKEKPVVDIYISDQFPGPTIEARSGDRLEIVVHNDLEDEELSLHWHGLYMRGTGGSHPETLNQKEPFSDC